MNRGGGRPERSGVKATMGLPSDDHSSDISPPVNRVRTARLGAVAVGRGRHAGPPTWQAPIPGFDAGRCKEAGKTGTATTNRSAVGSRSAIIGDLLPSLPSPA